MRDLWHTVTGWMDKNRFVFLSIMVVAMLAMITLTGCLESTITSLVNPSKKVNRSEYISEAAILETTLEIERADLVASMAAFNKKIELKRKLIQLGIENLDTQDAKTANFMKNVGGFGVLIAEGGMTTPGVIGSVVSLLGIAWGIGNKLDNKRKDTIIDSLKRVNS